MYVVKKKKNYAEKSKIEMKKNAVVKLKSFAVLLVNWSENVFQVTSFSKVMRPWMVNNGGGDSGVSSNCGQGKEKKKQFYVDWMYHK